MVTLRLTTQTLETPPRKDSYTVDFPLHMAECEANYFRLNKLIVDLQQDDHRFLIANAEQEWLQIFRVIERSRYTTTFVLKQLSIPPLNTWLQMPSLTIRMYHDAKVAEVLAWESHKRLRPRYDYPNQHMYQSDEKLQLNQFLGECLILCLNQGRVVDNFMPEVK